MEYIERIEDYAEILSETVLTVLRVELKHAKEMRVAIQEDITHNPHADYLPDLLDCDKRIEALEDVIEYMRFQ